MSWRPRGEMWKRTLDIKRWRPFRARPDVLAAIALLPPPTKIQPEENSFYDGASDRRRQEYREDTFFISLADGLGFPPGTAYEVARFYTSQAESGFVKGCWTWQEVTGDPLTPPRGTGTVFDALVQVRAGIQLRWHLKLSQQRQPAYGPYWTGSALQIPGHEFWEMPYWKDNRFLWGCPENSTLFDVPAGSVLRLYCEIVENPERLAYIGGRLWGFVQPANSKAATITALHGWQY